MSEGHDHLTTLLGRLKLTALRDQLDTLIDEAGRRELTIREALILDRLLHHSHVVTIRGDSYRLREKRRSGLLQRATPAPQPTPA